MRNLATASYLVFSASVLPLLVYIVRFAEFYICSMSWIRRFKQLVFVSSLSNMVSDKRLWLFIWIVCASLRRTTTVHQCSPPYQKSLPWRSSHSHGLNDSELKNFQPVSNLSFISKLMEKIVQAHIQAFLDSNGLMLRKQSAYRRFHSTETAVTKVFKDLLVAADDGQMSALYLLDLTHSSLRHRRP